MAYQKMTLKNYRAPLIELDKIHLSSENRAKISQLVEEFNYRHILKKYNLPVDNKLLLHGHTGCGKTATAHAIAEELGKEIVTIYLGEFISSKLGETSRNLSKVFKEVAYDQSILFIDEFDFIGKKRDYDDNDAGEVKRIVNTLIQLIDNMNQECLLICATNHLQIIDSAILRRFQLRLQYDLPSQENLDQYYDEILQDFPDEVQDMKRVYDISYAEAKDLIHQHAKKQLIEAEKTRMHLLFVYGDLADEGGQLITFGKKFETTPMELHGFTLKNRSDHSESTIAVHSKNENDFIKGAMIQVTGQELLSIEKERKTTHKRILIPINPAQSAWLFVAKNSF